MNVYNFSKLEKCYVCGNIDRNFDKFIKELTKHLEHYTKEEHPKEIERQERLKKRQADEATQLRGRMRASIDWAAPISSSNRNAKKMKPYGGFDDGYSNSVIIVSGNCGIGSKSMKFYQDRFAKLDKILADNNTFLLFVRGNNDDPSMFANKAIDFEHVKTLPDYSVVQVKSFNCLCIGGSVSIDKEWKLSQEKTFGKKFFWEDEAPIFNEEALDEILKNFQIDCVVTSTCPSFAYPSTNAFKRSKWFASSQSVKTNFNNERKILDKIYEKINESDSKPYVWFYGRFKMGHNDKINDILFVSLTSYQFTQVNNIISSFFGVDTSKKLELNTHTFEEILREFDAYANTRRFVDDLPNLEEEPFEDGGDEVEEEMNDEEAVLAPQAEEPRVVFADNTAVNNDIYWQPLQGEITHEPINLGHINYTRDAGIYTVAGTAATTLTDEHIGQVVGR